MMDAPFGWPDYLLLAKRRADSNSEADLRTAISRAYYACFNVADGLCRSSGIPIPDRIAPRGKRLRSKHSRLIHALKGHNSGYLRTAGELLASLRALRNIADYQLPFGRDVEIAARQAISLAEGVMDKLDTFLRGRQ